MAFFKKDRPDAGKRKKEVLPGTPNQIPALEIREIMTPKPIGLYGANNAFAWGDYSVAVAQRDTGTDPYYIKKEQPSLEVVGHDGNRIKNAEKIQGFPLQNDIDWEGKVRPRVPGKITRNSWGEVSIKPQDLFFDGLLVGLALGRTHDKSPATDVRWDTLVSSTSKYNIQNQHVAVLEKGRYVVAYDVFGGYMVFDTQDEQGRRLHPKKWKKTSYDGGEAIEPKAIEEYIKIIRAGNVPKILEINDKYTAKIFGDAIQIVRHAAPAGEILFSDKIDNVNGNICVDPNDPSIVYYCSSAHPTNIMKLNISGDSKTWKSKPHPLRAVPTALNSLQMDPSGYFFIYRDDKGIKILEKNGLHIYWRKAGKYDSVHFDKDSRIRAFFDGKFVAMEGNFEEVSAAIDKKKVGHIGGGLKQVGLKPGKKEITDPDLQREINNYRPVKAEQNKEFAAELVNAKKLSDINTIKAAAARLRNKSVKSGLRAEVVAFLYDDIDAAIAKKEQELIEARVSRTVADVRGLIQAGLTTDSLANANDKLKAIDPLRPRVPDSVKHEIQKITDSLQKAAAAFLKRDSTRIEGELKGTVQGVERKLKGFASKAEFDDWQENDFPRLKAKLGMLARQCPDGAADLYNEIIKALQEINQLSENYETQFRQQYAQVRAAVATRTQQAIGVIKHDVGRFFEIMVGKGFTARDDAEKAVAASEAKKQLDAEIAAVKTADPEAAKELERELKVKLSNFYMEVERGSLVTIAGTGQQMAVFGKTKFPVWEHAAKQLKPSEKDLMFMLNEQSMGPGVTPDKAMGDISFRITNSEGKKSFVRLFESRADESDWRLGQESFRGGDMMPSYVSGADFKKFKQCFIDWQRGAKSNIRKQYEEERKALHEHFKKRPKPQDEKPVDETAWKKRYLELLKEYTDFHHDHFIPHMFEAEKILSMPEPEYTNGKGLVPKWQSHWVLDPQTETYLEEMAQELKGQQKLQESLLLLKGHAGTGKDVLVKMFCERTRRPYYAIDCSKWTTEFELSEDIQYEAEDGATKTVKVPSVVLKAITTPGSVLYFNEINAMPDNAQIFLHSLMDEKRSLTLKTSSGKTVKADPSVLIMASMNPGYPGTFDPQQATRSRMVSLEIKYPPLFKHEPTAAVPRPHFNASEALRIARSTASLADFTYEANMTKNEFVKIWDRDINGVKGNGAPALSQEQAFDLRVVQALVQFGAKLRENFMIQFNKEKASRTALPVMLPLTLREMRRCANRLAEMSPAEKAKLDAEKVARDLINRYFLANIDNAEDQRKVWTAMQSWTTEKRT